MKQHQRGLTLLAMVVVFTGVGAAQPPIRYETINMKNAEQTSLFGINNNGDIVGYYLDKTGTHGLLILNETFQTLDNPECTYGTQFFNVNSHGTIVGSCVMESSGGTRGFMYEGGHFTAIGPPGCLASSATGINDNAEIVGWCVDSGNVVHGYLFNGSDDVQYRFIDYPDANRVTLAWGINNAGLVTLRWTDPSGDSKAAVYNSKTKEFSAPIAVPGAAQTYVQSINNFNDIVFYWDDTRGNSHGALLTNNQFYMIADPNGPSYTRAEGINDLHQIVGRYEVPGATFEQGFGLEYFLPPITEHGAR